MLPLLVDMHVVSGAGELLRAGKARRTRADHGNRLAGLDRRRLGLHPAFGKRAVDDRAFDRLDRDGVVVDVERARGFARRRADAAGELGEIVGRVQVARRLAPRAGIDEVVPVRDLVVDRATRVTIRDAAVHAARRLVAHLAVGQRLDEFPPMLDARLDRLVVAVVALELEKPGDLAHAVRYQAVRDQPPATASSGSAVWMAFISVSARRYSSGITLRNIGR